MAAPSDLTTRANVKSLLSLTLTTDDALLDRLITAMSRAFAKEIGHEIARRAYLEVLDGGDERIKVRSTASPWAVGPLSGLGAMSEFGARGFAIDLKNYPVIGDPVVLIDGSPIAKRPVLLSGDPNNALSSDGWVLLDHYRLELVGNEFTGGIGNVSISHEAAEQTFDEPVTIPGSPFQYQALQPDGAFQSDSGVKYAVTQVPLVKVAAAPALGQYAVGAGGLYTFAAADVGAAVLVSYCMTPADIEQAVIDMVAFAYRAKDRIAQRSKSVGNEVISFVTDAWPDSVQMVIDRWRRVPV